MAMSISSYFSGRNAASFAGMSADPSAMAALLAEGRTTISAPTPRERFWDSSSRPSASPTISNIIVTSIVTARMLRPVRIGRCSRLLTTRRLIIDRPPETLPRKKSPISFDRDPLRRIEHERLGRYWFIHARLEHLHTQQVAVFGSVDLDHAWERNGLRLEPLSIPGIRHEFPAGLVNGLPRDMQGDPVEPDFARQLGPIRLPDRYHVVGLTGIRDVAQERYLLIFERSDRSPELLECVVVARSQNVFPTVSLIRCGRPGIVPASGDGLCTPCRRKSCRTQSNPRLGTPL